MELTIGTRKTIVELRKKGIIFVLLSASPYSEEIANKELRGKLEHFNLLDLFYSYHSSPGDQPEGKGKIMLEILISLNINKEDALMIGDSFFYDYLPAKNIGIDAFFIKNECAKMPDKMPSDLQTIKEVSDVLKILT